MRPRLTDEQVRRLRQVLRQYGDDEPLRDGQSIRVPMMMRDSLTSLQRAVAAEWPRNSAPLVTHAAGGTARLPRPGFRLADPAARDAASNFTMTASAISPMHGAAPLAKAPSRTR